MVRHRIACTHTCARVGCRAENNGEWEIFVTMFLKLYGTHVIKNCRSTKRGRLTDKDGIFQVDENGRHVAVVLTWTSATPALEPQKAQPSAQTQRTHNRRQGACLHWHIHRMITFHKIRFIARESSRARKPARPKWRTDVWIDPCNVTICFCSDQ